VVVGSGHHAAVKRNVPTCYLKVWYLSNMSHDLELVRMRSVDEYLDM
jgi:hypothetical protein